MKRSHRIHLVLIGTVSAGALAGCKPPSAPITAQDVFTNNHYLPGAGYYHAPYQAWYSLPYNQPDPQRNLFFHGGRWTATPHESVVNVSSPTPEALRQATAMRTDVRRGGFGSSSHRSSFFGG